LTRQLSASEIRECGLTVRHPVDIRRTEQLVEAKRRCIRGRLESLKQGDEVWKFHTRRRHGNISVAVRILYPSG